MRKKKTHDEYVNELKEKNPNVEVIEKYNGSRNSIKHRCLICGYEWDVTPDTLLSGHGCPRCYGNIKKTTEEYKKELLEKNPNIEVLGEYIGANSPIVHKCKIHDVIWESSPHNILRGRGCPECGKEKYSLSRKKTHEEYVAELKIVNPTIEVIDNYIDALTNITHHCLIHDVYWETTPSRALGGVGCPICHKERCHFSKTRTQEEYEKEVKEISPHIIVLDKFINIRTPIKHKCLIHNIEWVAHPEGILKGCGCSECGNDKIREKFTKTHSEYVSELQKINPDIKVIEDYKGSTTPILHRCLVDGYEWKTSPTTLLSGCGCPQCNESVGERNIRQWLISQGIKYEPQKKFLDCKDRKELPFDFYLPELNICIEFDGEQHRRPIDYFGGEEAFKICVKHDQIKTQYCQDNNIRLLRIDNIKDIDKELNNFLLA